MESCVLSQLADANVVVECHEREKSIRDGDDNHHNMDLPTESIPAREE